MSSLILILRIPSLLYVKTEVYNCGICVDKTNFTYSTLLTQNLYFLVIGIRIASGLPLEVATSQSRSVYLIFLFNMAVCSSQNIFLQVWDVTPSKPVLKYVINTIASVGRVKWRPMRKHQLASTALVVDWNVNIWDLKRPFIPFECFQGHRDIVTDIAWRTDPKSVVSCGRVCLK